MSCKKYCECNFCIKNSNCLYEHMGDGSPWCREFECTVQDCKRSECISYDEVLSEYMNL